MEKLYISKTFLKMTGGRMHTPHPTYLPVSASGHKLQKPSKKFGIFQSLGTINFVLFTKRQSQRGEGREHGPPPKYVPGHLCTHILCRFCFFTWGN